VKVLEKAEKTHENRGLLAGAPSAPNIFQERTLDRIAFSL
jgi:hypothetical protein